MTRMASRVSIEAGSCTSVVSELIDNPVLLRATAFSIVTIILATEFAPLQRVLDTVDLTTGQWAVSIAVAASIVVICEVKKALHIQTGEEPEAAAAAASAVA